VVLLDQKLNTLQHIINNITEDLGFFGSIISSEEGLIIFTSNQVDPKIELESLAAKAASLFNDYREFSENPEDITISYTDKKIFIQKISLTNNSDNGILLITIMPQNIRYFRRKVNKIAKHLSDSTILP
jgi:predicted regulator of Ras-like GTPase activity (Roadblock/LC7/MglB family)